MPDTPVATSQMRPVKRPAPPAGGGGRRRKLNWPYALVSLLFGTMLWFGVDLKRMGETVIDVDVRYENQLPADWKFLSPPMRTVRVALRGPNQEIANLRKEEIHIEPEYPKTMLDGDAYEGGLTFLPQQVKELPSGVEVLSVQPNILSVRLAKMITRYLTVEPGEITGTPEEGYVVGRVRQIDPPAMPISASREFLSKLTSTDVLRTKAFSIDGGKGLVGANVGLEPLSKDGESVAVPGIVYMMVDLEEVPAEREFEQPLEVRALINSPFDQYARLTLDPPSVKVAVAGPKSVVDRLGAGEVLIYADLRDRIPAAAGEFNIKLKAVAPARVRVARIEPDTVKWIFRSEDAESAAPAAPAAAPAPAREGGAANN